MRLTDDSRMPFGVHKDERMRDVPASYLDYIIGQDWIDSWPFVKAYIEENLDRIHDEVRKELE